jgi:hypothetical protein
MKILFRILVVFVIAALIGGVCFALVNGNGTTTTNQQQSEFQRHGDRHGHNGGFSGVAIPFGMVRNLIVVSIIAVVYLNAGKWLGKGKGTSRPARLAKT